MREILDHLMDAGYDPAEDGDWADLVASGVGSIRVDWSEDGEIRVHRFDRYLATLWSSRFDRAMPAEIILAAIEAAEAELARDAGGRSRRRRFRPTPSHAGSVRSASPATGTADDRPGDDARAGRPGRGRLPGRLRRRRGRGQRSRRSVDGAGRRRVAGVPGRAGA